MREITIVFGLDERKAEIFAGRDIMAVPLSTTERPELGQNLNGVADFLAFSARCLSTLQQVLESKQDAAAQVGQISKLLEQLLEPTRGAVQIQDRIRELIGRAIFVAGTADKGRMN